MQIHPLPAFSDNYIWMIMGDDQRALVVDPGDAAVVSATLAERGLVLDTILITHHHPDHTGGVAALHESTGARVFGPRRESMPEPLTRLGAGDRVDALGIRFEVLDVPGHTAGHIAYFAAQVPDAVGTPVLFCGDTLFSGGCGRLFEGTPAQMLDSLSKLSALPGQTRVCCTHEYTLSNLRFALAVEPGNTELQDYNRHCVAERAAGRPTLPSRIALEQDINPFLRSAVPTVMASARARGAADDSPVAVFAALREWKNTFQ